MLSLTSVEQSQPDHHLFWKLPPCLSKDYLNYQTSESAKTSLEISREKGFIIDENNYCTWF